MFDRLLKKAFGSRDNKSKSKCVLRFAPRKNLDDNRPARNRLQKRMHQATPAVQNSEAERAEDDDLTATFQPQEWPSVEIDRRGTGRYPRGDSPLVDALRGRSRSSPPPATRGLAAHPSASKPLGLKREKTVRWGSPLEVRGGTPTQEEEKTETKEDDSTTSKQEPASRITPSDEDTSTETSTSSSTDGSTMEEDEEGLVVNESQPLRFLRRTRSCRNLQVADLDSKTTSIDVDSFGRRRSLFVPQAIPAPLRITPKRQSLMGPLSISTSAAILNVSDQTHVTS